MNTKFKKSFDPSVDILINYQTSPSLNRDELFKQYIAEVINRRPMLQVVYAYLTNGMTIKNDFVCVFKYYDTNIATYVYVIDLPLIGTSKCLAGFAYAKDSLQLDKYFEDVTNTSVLIPNKAFNSYLDKSGIISSDPKSPKYWKKPENINELLNIVTEMATMYTSPRSK